MTVANDPMSLNQVLQEFNRIIIPDVQRDYVMGSGEEKLTKLLTAMAESNEQNEKFSFSCLVGYKDKNNNLYIYDGQQRLATLVYLCSNLLVENNVEIKKMLEKFSFTNREVANSWLSDSSLINELNAVDFTTYSLAQLIKTFENQSYYKNYTRHKFSDKIMFDFLFNKVVFNLILVNQIDDAEQFFLDINDGLDLKSYELYKAELYHHATDALNENEFKRFSLKMDNEWLKKFIPFRHMERKYINGEWKYIELHCEEEMLVFFLQYCFRMIWIEEKGHTEGYKSENVNWLEEGHFQRVEQILNALLEEINSKSLDNVTCIDFSDPYKNFTTRGQHWSISDVNYNAMLSVFLKNVYNVEETEKDVVIWSYISKLPFVKQNKNILYEYLRFLKKILNNNRAENSNAKIYFYNKGVESKKVVYSRYYVNGIPEYYIGNKVYCDEDAINFINTLIVLNKKYTLDSEDNFVDVYLNSCNNELINGVLKKEKQKQKSHHKELIEKLENLNFINGLVDNFLIYSNASCYLKTGFDENFYISISKAELEKDKYQYKNILKFIYKNNIDICNSLFDEITISWTNYGNQTIHYSKGSLIPHTWGDFFTSQKGLIKNEDSSANYLDYLPDLPDGWIKNKKIIQPEDNDVNDKPGFASYSRTHVVIDMSSIFKNFSEFAKI